MVSTSLAPIMGRITPIIDSVKAAGPLGGAIKCAGALGAGIVLYDAHKRGVMTAKKDKQNTQADFAYSTFRNSQYMNNGSHFTTLMKRKLFHWELGEKISGAVAGTIGYVKGFVGNAIGHVVPAALSVGAIIGKGNVAKGSAIGLLAYSAFSLFSGGQGSGK